ncbi:MAG: hypothetical protein OHK0046_20980 [Anaerolineae bacterium]
MGKVSYQTYNASGYLIDLLRAAGMIRVMHHDGGDIVLFETMAGDKISIHFIDSGIPLYEVRNILKGNEEQGIYTLFMLWVSMMLPHEGQRYLAEDWMEALYHLNNGLIYGYDIYDAEVYIFPVVFEGETRIRQVSYGTTIRARRLTTRKVKTGLPGFMDEWWVADFEGTTAEHRQTLATTSLAVYYELLGVLPGDDLETIKQAYRVLARRYHPDTNPDADAHEMMQRVNEAYAKISSLFE